MVYTAESVFVMGPGIVLNIVATFEFESLVGSPVRCAVSMYVPVVITPRVYRVAILAIVKYIS